jgi:16S rRNA (guanine527-N7)-methyltransferase
MNTARIAELLEPFLCAPIIIPDDSSIVEAGLAPDVHSAAANSGERSAVLSPAQLQHISTYIDILCRWNARINLTAIRDPEEVVTRHFGESLFAARNLFSGESAGLEGRVADVGSGAGFPGLPIKLWAPQLSLTLIESNHKKAAFLREVSRALTLMDVNIQNARAEALGAAAFDVVTLRAVERFESILPTAAALVAPAGRLALLISSAQQDQAQAALPDFTWSSAVPIPGSSSRILSVAVRIEGREPG